jgi:hypothetical protein
MLRIRIRIRIRTFSGLPDPLVTSTDDRIPLQILQSSSKNSKKPLEFYCFLTCEVRIRGSRSASGSVTKCHEPATLVGRRGRIKMQWCFLQINWSTTEGGIGIEEDAWRREKWDSKEGGEKREERGMKYKRGKNKGRRREDGGREACLVNTSKYDGRCRPPADNSIIPPFSQSRGGESASSQ